VKREKLTAMSVLLMT